MTINDQIQGHLNDLKQQGLFRQLRLLTGAQGRAIIVDGKRVLNFSSNNYLGLADDPRLIAAATKAMRAEGFGAGASRLVCGSMSAHAQLEDAMATFKGTQRALVFNSGYAANTGVIPALFDRQDIIFTDKLNHASIIDGIVLSRAAFKRYAHKDLAMLEEGLKSASGYRRRLIVTDSVFSMDGDVAPLQDIVRLARRYDALVMVDEAHGVGVLGEHGTGLVEHVGLQGQVDIQMGTFSKAVGSFGAYVCASAVIIEQLINHARSFIYTTALPPAIAAASLRGIQIIEQEPQLRQVLLANAEQVRRGAQALGFHTLASTTSIIPIVLKEAATVVDVSRRLLEQGIFVQAIRPPTVPVNTARLRVTVMATHTKDDLKRLLDALHHCR